MERQRAQAGDPAVCKRRYNQKGGAKYVSPAERIAVFDNDGTLWAEQPLYFQLLFAIDRIKELAPAAPEWKEKDPFKSVLAGDMKAALPAAAHSLLEIVVAGAANMTTEEYDVSSKNGSPLRNIPKTGRPYSEMVYQPMLELLAYLRANGFKTFIVSGGGIDFMRAFAEKVYGIPPEQVLSAARGKTSVRNARRQTGDHEAARAGFL